MRSAPPRIDDEVRRRLTARFGDEIGPWFDELPAVLSVLADRWQVDFDSFIPRGSMSVVIRCRLSSGRPAVLKIGPDRTRVANEGAALERWTSIHTPSVLAVDVSAGAPQTRPGAKGALLFSAALPPSEFESPWPQGVPLQIHMMEGDEWALEDLDAARQPETSDGAELFLYPGDGHLFADNSLPD